MRLLLDVHLAPSVAGVLADSGYDVLAAAGAPRLAVLEDEDLLRFAAAEERALVTENAKDFGRIVRAWAAAGEHHSGLVCISPRRIRRGLLSYPEDLTASLRRLLEDPPEERDGVWWLD